MLSFTAALGVAAMLAGCGGASGATAEAASGGQLTDLVLGGPATAANGLSTKPLGVIGYALDQPQAQGILAKYGFHYSKFAAFDNGPPAAQALASGSVQLAAIGDAPAVLSRAAGQQNRALTVLSSPGGTWIAGHDGGPTSLQGLAGKKVGVQFGSNFDRYLRTALAQAGLTSKVQLVNLLVADGYGALTGGSIDAYSGPATTVALWQAKGGVSVIDKAEKSHPDYTSAMVTLVNADFLTAHPKLQKAWWEVTKLGLDTIKKDPAAYYAWTTKTQGYPADVVKATTVLAYPDQPIADSDVAGLQKTQDFLVGAGVAKSPFDVSAWVVQ
jgi:ABC-type nitrate/sulfonate/bicarbonate transport system substrate-binding protein